jgi:subtilisin family serine protease
MSFGFSETDLKKINDACDSIRSHPKILFVAAAGNEHTDNDVTPFFPGNCKAPNMLTVGAVDSAGKKAPFSNYGKNSVQIAAEGVDIPVDLGHGISAKQSGTSLAAPKVANVAAKILAIKPDLSPDEVIAIIRDTAKIDPSYDDLFTFKGSLNEEAALARAKQEPAQ